jgi:hypothetical protein
MLLYDIFLEICAQNMSSSYQDVSLKQTDLELALKREVACYRTLADPKKVAAYRHFLHSCKKSMQGKQELPILPILINALSDEEFPFDDKSSCEILAQLFYRNTHEQKNTRTLTLLGQPLIDTPKAFIAFLVCLCRHGVKPKSILSTHLVHDFFRYYLNTLGVEQNAIHQLFQNLSLFPEAKWLVKKMQTVKSDERSFTGALDGVMRDGLINVAKKTVSIKYTPTLTNLKGLHLLFGEHFLFSLLCQWQTRKSNSFWHDFIIQLFNRQDVVETQLPMLLTRLYESQGLQQALAEILEESTLHFFIDKRSGDILCLMPYCPKLVEAIQNLDLNNYLKESRQRASSGLALISGLLSLLDYLQKAHKNSVNLVFEKLIEALLEEPYVLEDETVLCKIRKFPLSNSYILQKVISLEAEFDAVLASETNDTIALLDYTTVEDKWHKVIAKISLLQQVVEFDTKCPKDKYELYIRLAKSFFLQNKIVFDLNTFTKALKIKPDFSKDITPYERLIIELLGAIDHEPLRVQCISLLNKHVPDRTWRSHAYGDTNFYQRAISAGNLGLIEWLHIEHVKPSVSYDALAIEAARLNHWSIVAHIYKNHALKTFTSNILLNKAVEQGASHAIAILGSNAAQMPSIKQIEQSFILATKKNDAESLRYILQYLKRLNENVLVRAFNQAIKLNNLEAAAAIAEHKKGKNLTNAINDAILDASRSNQWEVIHHLIPFSRLNVIERAFLNAARENHLPTVRYLVENTFFIISKPVIKRGWNEAKKCNRTAIAIYLNSLHFECKASFTLQIPPPKKPIIRRSVSCDAILSKEGLVRYGLFSPKGMKKTTSLESASTILTLSTHST